MARVVFVHGVGKQYLSEDSLARDIVPELLGGIRLAGGPVPDPTEVGVAFYGDLFRPSGTRARDVSDYDATDVETDDEFELLMLWWTAAAELDPNVPGPNETGTRGPAGWALSQSMRIKLVRAALDALTGASFLQGVTDRMLIGDLKQMTTYFADETVRGEAQRRLATHIGPETQVIVAHSLGSVVAYETLCTAAQADRDIPMLVTLGSPLGMGSLVLDRLRPAARNRTAVWPKPLRRWTNIADDTDIVAMVRELRPAFGSRVNDLRVNNGTKMHGAIRYLTATETGSAITAGLRKGDEPTRCDT
ncbi:hypothetical protein [Nocardia sp. CA-145437]|uniref:hypothetical protein n=1 Tax=Nocardia sp. CA-145437 TaxID=3239980 RepID=UPI003D95B713